MKVLADETDLQLLARYAREGAEDAFAELVRRHIDLVFSAALRQVRSPQLAEEVAQSVFTDLARNAGKLKPDTILTAWLYQVTRRTAVDVVRRESRRQSREQIATAMNAANNTNDIPNFAKWENKTGWPDIEPLLEEAMSTLDDTDRAVLLLRYFENKPLREVGRQLGISEDAAQKRVSRAVERLREFFVKRGVTVGAGGLVAAISANAVQAAPAGLGAAISNAVALAGTTLAPTTTATVAKAVAMTTLQKTIIGAALVAAVGTGIYEARQAAQLRGQVRALQQQQAPLAEQVRQLQRERDEARSQLAALREDNERLNRNTAELLRLCGEVARLREENRAIQLAKLTKPQREPEESSPNSAGGDPLPIVRYSATAHVVVPWDRVVVTGGWRTAPGKRTFVFVAPKRTDDSGQVEVQTRVIEFPIELVAALDLDRFKTDEQQAEVAGVLTSDQYQAVLKAALESDVAKITGTEAITTFSGRAAQMQVVDIRTSPSGEQYFVGPVVNVVPTIAPNGESVAVKVNATLNRLESDHNE